MSETQGNGLLIGFLVGAVAGAGVALLLAPCSGEETRRKLNDSARRVGRDAKAKLDDVKGTIVEKVSALRQDVNEAVEAGRHSAHELMEKSTSSRISSL